MKMKFQKRSHKNKDPQEEVSKVAAKEANEAHDQMVRR